MKTIKYTIRNVPVQVDRYLRKRAQISGQSLNQVIIEELSDKVTTSKNVIGDSLDWFIGKGSIGDDVLAALAEDDITQKHLAAKI